MKKKLKILLLEDSSTDAGLIERILKKSHLEFELKHVANKKSYLEAIGEPSDIILSDNSLPGFSATEALQIIRQRSIHIPFILVTGTVSEEFAAAIMKLGADDYLLKDRMVRLPAAIELALKQRQILKELSDYRYAMDQSSIVAITDQKGIIIYANDNFCKISKYSKEELIGQDHRIVNSNYHPAPYIRNLWTTIAHGKIWRGEFRNKAKDGSLYWVDSTIVPLLDEKKKPYQYLSIRTDITERKLAEENLIRTQLRFKQAQETAHLGNWEVNFETNTSWWSDEAYRIYGLTPGDHNLSMEDWIAFIHPDDIEHVKQLIDRSGATLSDLAFQHRIVRKDGSVRHIFSQSKYELDKTGKPVGLYGVALDITEIKKATEELRMSEISLKQAQALAHISNWEIDLTNNIHKWSDEFYKIYGVNKGEAEPSEELFISLIHPDDKAFAKKKIEEAFSTLKDSSFTFRFIRKDGTLRHGYTEWYFEFDKKGTAKRLFGILQDITERKEAEEERKQLEQQLFEQKRKEQLKITATALEAQEKERTAIGIELHDNVNQILVATKMHLKMVKGKTAESDEFVNTSVDYLDQAIQENRRIAHALVTPDLQIGSLIQQLKDLATSMLGKTGVKINFSSQSFNEKLITNSQKIAVYRIAQEQCTNIIKYAGATTVTISLSTAASAFSMVIADNGKGMEKEKKMNGIGLKNINSRLSVFEGSVKIDTAPGKGFKLEISIPLDEERT